MSVWEGKIRFASALMMLMGLTLIAGCIQAPPKVPRAKRGPAMVTGDSEEDFQRLFAAARTVLSRSYRIVNENPRLGMLYAESDISAPGISKMRNEVWVRIDRNRFGGYDIQEVRVNRKAEISHANSRGAQPTYDWVTLEFDQAEEARLIREIRKLAGAPERAKPNEAVTTTVTTVRL